MTCKVDTLDSYNGNFNVSSNEAAQKSYPKKCLWLLNIDKYLNIFNQHPEISFILGQFPNFKHYLGE